METPIEASEAERLSDAFFAANRPALRYRDDMLEAAKKLMRDFESTLEVYGKTFGEEALSELRNKLKKNLDNKAPESGEQKILDEKPPPATGQSSSTGNAG